MGLVGQRFDRLVVVDRSGRHWSCRCDCGRTHTVAGSDLRRGFVRSCGCLKREGLRTTHGRSKKGGEYWIWQAMKRRCDNPKNVSYANYGGRGITVCPAWRDSFEAFLRDIGPRPPGHSLDRLHNDKPYEPGNVRWATRATQANNTRANRRITHAGATKTLSEWAHAIGVPVVTLHHRLAGGWSLDRALAQNP